MDNNELSAQFDIFWNNVSSNQAPGLNEYEKSVFLTKAQNQLVIEYFNPKTDAAGGGFDGSPRRHYDFSSIIKTSQLSTTTSANKIDGRSKVYNLPPDYFLAVNEQVFYNGRQYSVMPIDYEEYQRLMMKPYQLPVKRAAWRMITNGSIVELIGNFPIAPDYYMRYVRTLKPIILIDLKDEYGSDDNDTSLITIEGEHAVTQCELPKECQEELLERAVTLAKITWQGGTATQAAQSSKQQ